MSMSYNMSCLNSPRSQNRVTFAPCTYQYQSSSVPQTPKSRSQGSSKRSQQSMRSRHQQSRAAPSVPYAGSSFTDSPSARAVPLPPSNWIDELCPNSESDSDNMSVADSVSSSSSSHSVSGPSPTNSNPSVSGIRLNPLQLIAAVAVAAS